jgi:CMP-N-acetylneuraminic acid synthetase
MGEQRRAIAIIPARSGSKGLKDKNIRLLGGKPLLAYSVEAAIQSGIFDTVHVSTDSQEYADIAAAYGADVPFLRDVRNAEDASSTWDAVREVLRHYAGLGRKFDICVLLQPTSPMRNAKDVQEAYAQFTDSRARSLTSVTAVDHPVQWCFRLDSACSLREFASSPYKNSRRQELEPYYRENGAIYMVGTDDILDPDFDFYSDECIAYVMERSRSIDIDTLEDFLLAEILMKPSSEE